MKLRRFLTDTAGILTGLLLITWLCLPRPPLLDGIKFSSRITDRNGTLLWTSLSPDDKYRIYQPLNGSPPS